MASGPRPPFTTHLLEGHWQGRRAALCWLLCIMRRALSFCLLTSHREERLHRLPGRPPAGGWPCCQAQELAAHQSHAPPQGPVSPLGLLPELCFVLFLATSCGQHSKRGLCSPFLSRLFIAQTKPGRNWVARSQGVSLHGDLLLLCLRLRGS